MHVFIDNSLILLIDRLLIDPKLSYLIWKIIILDKIGTAIILDFKNFNINKPILTRQVFNFAQPK